MPRRPREEPSALDQLDPAPREQRAPAPPEPRRPRKPPEGPMGKTVLDAMKRLPDDPDLHLIALGALVLARELDAGMVDGRDKAGHVREVRQCVTVLREMAPEKKAGSKTDELARKREERMQPGG